LGDDWLSVCLGFGRCAGRLWPVDCHSARV